MEKNMKKFMDSKWGKRIEEAVAFRINFHSFVYGYDDCGYYDYFEEICSKCGKEIQIKDYEAPRSTCKKEYSIIDTYYFGVSENIKNLLVQNDELDITNADFRPIRNKSGDIVYYQITPQHTMLPITSVNPRRELKPCKKCGGIQYRSKEMVNENDERYYYITKEALEEMHDINVTYEHFNMYMPDFVISRKAYDFLIEKYPRMQFNPMFLKDSE